MSIRHAFVIAVLLAGLPAGPAWAQAAGQNTGRPGDARPDSKPSDPWAFKWWQSEQFKTELGLGVDQIARLESVFQTLRPRMTDAMDSLRRLEKQLSDTIAEGVASEAEVMKQDDLVEAQRAELGRTRTLMFYRMHRILTPDQRVKMKALHDKWEQERRQRGRRDPGRMPR